MREQEIAPPNVQMLSRSSVERSAAPSALPDNPTVRRGVLGDLNVWRLIGLET
jgi:hypothetical protein